MLLFNTDWNAEDEGTDSNNNSNNSSQSQQVLSPLVSSSEDGDDSSSASSRQPQQQQQPKYGSYYGKPAAHVMYELAYQLGLKNDASSLW